MHLDKAPDAFRTISEVADDLDIPQHVLRFWETRFAQIKPMKRSGGRRYYRPDDVDLLRGIRRLLYGEGYTIRGVQRILKENGIGAVQRLAEQSGQPAFPAAEEEARHPAPKADRETDADRKTETASPLGHDVDQPAGPMPEPPQPRGPAPRAAADQPGLMPAASENARLLDVAKLQTALGELLACRRILDGAIKDG